MDAVDLQLEPEEWAIVIEEALLDYSDLTPSVLFYVGVQYIIEREGYTRDMFFIDYQNQRAYILKPIAPADFNYLLTFIPQLYYYV